MSHPFFKHRLSSINSHNLPADDNSTRARMLDLMADAELQQGHYARAEDLAWRADALRSEVRA